MTMESWVMMMHEIDKEHKAQEEVCEVNIPKRAVCDVKTVISSWLGDSDQERFVFVMLRL